MACLTETHRAWRYRVSQMLDCRGALPRRIPWYPAFTVQGRPDRACAHNTIATPRARRPGPVFQRFVPVRRVTPLACHRSRVAQLDNSVEFCQIAHCTQLALAMPCYSNHVCRSHSRPSRQSPCRATAVYPAPGFTQFPVPPPWCRLTPMPIIGWSARWRRCDLGLIQMIQAENSQGFGGSPDWTHSFIGGGSVCPDQYHASTCTRPTIFHIARGVKARYCRLRLLGQFLEKGAIGLFFLA